MLRSFDIWLDIKFDDPSSLPRNPKTAGGRQPREVIDDGLSFVVVA